MNSEELQTVLTAHALWASDNTSGTRASLSYSTLIAVDLSGANLSGANLSGADLSHATIRGANLSYANLSGANLRAADLGGADLSYADLSYANLSGSDLSGADLSYAYLSGADLSGSDLSGADLSFAKGITLAQDGNYMMIMVHGETPMIKAGCRWFTLEAAAVHWASHNQHFWTIKTQEYGESQRAMLNYLIGRSK